MNSILSAGIKLFGQSPTLTRPLLAFRSILWTLHLFGRMMILYQRIEGTSDRFLPITTSRTNFNRFLMHRMGNFIQLPDQRLLLINGVGKGSAGYGYHSSWAINQVRSRSRSRSPAHSFSPVKLIRSTSCTVLRSKPCDSSCLLQSQCSRWFQV